MKKDTLNSFLLVLLYSVFVYVFMFFLFQRDMVRTLPTNDRLETLWDAGWYKSIAQNGYQYKETEGSNVAFFILFPTIWKLSHLNGWGISFLNILFFASGFAIFTRIYKLTTVEKLVMVSFPSFYFCLIPYTEALFTLLISLLLFGIARKNRMVIWISLLLVAIARPTSMILFPALLITEIITNERKNILKAIGTFFITYGIPIIIGLAFMLWYQYYSTGVWFAWSKAEKHWGKVLSMPALPFNSMNGPKLLWINALGMFVGLVSLIVLIKYGWKWLMKNIPQTDKMAVLSFLYMTAILLTTILFNAKWGTNTTNVFDVLRFVFPNPFFWVFIYHFAKDKIYKIKDYAFIFLLSNLLWLSFAHYQHILYFIYFNFSTAIVLLYMAYADKRNTWPPMIIVAINLIVQVNLFQFYLENIPPG